MISPLGRRGFLKNGLVFPGLIANAPPCQLSAGQSGIPGVEPLKLIRVRIWDERQKEQKQVYPNFLGNWIADYLATKSGFKVLSVTLSDPEQGLAQKDIEETDVLIWWGHVRQADVSRATGLRIVERIKQGKLGLIALHSAHWATPFVEVMNDRTKTDMEKVLARSNAQKKIVVQYREPPQRYTVPKANDRITPFLDQKKFPDGTVQATVQLPYCCFPTYRSDGKPSRMRVVDFRHPIAKGIDPVFSIPHTEMYNEPFHVPEPDEVVLEECWDGGEWFRSGMVWKIGAGRVFYFRPGHETFPVFKETTVLNILENAVNWIGRQIPASG